MKPARRPLATIAIDPSATAGGYCVDLGTEIVFGTARIDQLDSVPIESWDADVIVLCIECPKRMYRGSNHVVRATANLWLNRIKKAFPRRVVVVGSKTGFVDPDIWRKAILANVPGDDWKSKALWLVTKMYPHITDHNQAEAWCLLQFARNAYRLKIARDNANRKTNPKPRKQK